MQSERQKQYESVSRLEEPGRSFKSQSVTPERRSSTLENKELNESLEAKSSNSKSVN